MAADDAAIRALLQAVLAALDVPEHTGFNRADERAQHRLMERRMSDVSTVLAGVLGDVTPAVAAQFLTERTASSPATYTAYVPADAPVAEEPVVDESTVETPAADVPPTPARPSITPARTQGRVRAEPATITACRADYESESGAAAREALTARATHQQD